MLTPEDPATIHLRLAHVLQGADGIRGLKGSKGEKVSEVDKAGAFLIFLKIAQDGSPKLDFVSHQLTNLPENRERMVSREPKERWERGETLEKMVLWVAAEKMDPRALKARLVLGENSVPLVLQERRHVA